MQQPYELRPSPTVGQDFIIGPEETLRETGKTLELSLVLVIVVIVAMSLTSREDSELRVRG
jgi:hypothetical protein